jgi:PAS domain-containing protein
MRDKKPAEITRPSSRGHTASTAKAPAVSQTDKLSEIAELLQNNDILKAAFNANSDPLAVIDPDFKLAAVNKAFARMINRKPEAKIGRK